jgi:MerR family transcriptional regulator/heat shock protein HspR
MRVKIAIERSPTEPVYLIGVVAQLTGLHPQTVRLYERIGLVRPRRVANKNRVYCDADVERLLKIRRFTQEMGVNLAGVEVILGLLDQVEQMRNDLEDLRAEVARLGADLPVEPQPIIPPPPPRKALL